MKYLCTFFLSLLPFLGFPSPQQTGSKQPFPDSTLIFLTYFTSDSVNTPIQGAVYDTAPDLVHRYDPLTQKSAAYSQQGNIGHYAKNLIAPTPSFSVFNAGFQGLEAYRFIPETLPSYIHEFPFSELKYVMGKKREQLLHLNHSQNMGKLLTFSFQYRIINSPGLYKNLKSDNYNLYTSLFYHSKNGRYRVMAGWVNNLLKLQENGGISADSLFEDNLENKREVIPVHLYKAKNRFLDNTYFLNQEYRWLPEQQANDTNILKKNSLYNLLPVFVKPVFSYSFQNCIYEDEAGVNLFYPFTPLDTGGTMDLLASQTYKFGLFLFNARPGEYPLRYYLRGGYQSNRMRNSDMDTTLNQTYAEAVLEADLPDRISFRGRVSRVFGDYSDGNAYYHASLLKTLGKGKFPFELKVGISNSQQQADWVLSHYRSNYFLREKGFDPIRTTEYKLEVSWHGYKLSLRNVESFNELIFLPHTGLPWQVNKNIAIQHLSMHKRFYIRSIRLDNEIDWQQSPEDSVLHFPTIITRHALYFDLHLFKGALNLQPGIEATYYSGFYPDAFMPTTRSFFLQYERKVPGRVYFDIFVDMKISKARLFLKYQHANSSLGTYDYYLLKNYPMQDAGLKFGLVWLLRDLPGQPKGMKSSGGNSGIGGGEQ